MSLVLNDVNSLVLRHLSCGKQSSYAPLMKELEEELRSGLRGAEDSELSQVFRFARDGTISVEIYQLDGSRCLLDTTMAATVGELKAGIEHLTQIPRGQQRLVHGQQVLHDHFTLAAYKVSPLRPSLSLVRIMDGCLYAVGGSDGASRLDSCEVLDPSVEGSWKPLPPMATRRGGLAAAVLHGVLYAVGGFNGAERLNSTEAFDLSSRAWRSVAPMISRRVSLAAVSSRDHIIALGGDDGEQQLASAEEYDPILDAWRALPEMAERRGGPGAAMLEGRLWVVGGWDSATRLRTVELLEEPHDGGSSRWVAGASMWEARSGVAACALGGRLFAMGGSVGYQILASTEVYDPASGIWAALRSMAVPRLSLAAGVVDGQIYVVGGSNNGQHMASGEVFDATAGRWSELPAMAVRRGGLAIAVGPSSAQLCQHVATSAGSQHLAT